MPLRPGTRLGPYEVIAAIGAGGMGEVYKARDTRLDRTVAIKVLLDAVAHDPERLARFEREAKTLAALNHTNVAQIYGMEGSALAMEYVEGQDLSQRIAQGPLPIDDALAIARQIADGLEAAHEFGIVHRDLKPSNIRLREDGTVKVLDFGLAKALAPAASLVESTSAPTITSPALTNIGVVLGTAAYMSPEQAKGRTIDKRADIWAFGVVLYEMITGRRPFEGETVSEALAAVIKSEPDWSPIPPRLQRLLKSCLEKDPKRRLRDIGDWSRQVDDLAGTPPAKGRFAWLAWTVAAACLVAGAALAFVYFRETTPAAETVRFHVAPPDKTTMGWILAVAPDGRRVAFTARDANGTTRVWIRDLDTLESRPVAGTDGAAAVYWSPDGRFFAFVVDRFLKKVAAGGGPPITLCEVNPSAALGGGSWSPAGVIVFGGVFTGAIRSVPDSGGDLTPLTALDPSRQEVAHGIPEFLPDGRHFLYLRISRSPEHSGIYIGAIDRKPDEQSRTRLLASAQTVRYARTGGRTDYLVFLRQGTLLAQAFDPDRLTLAGDAFPITDGVGNSGAAGFFSVGGGTVVYRTGAVAEAGQRAQLTWLDRQGKSIGSMGNPGTFQTVDLSPDGTRAAVVPASITNPDVWIMDLSRGVANRFISNTAVDRFPVWSPDSARIAFVSNRGGVLDLYEKSSSGEGNEELIVKSDQPKTATSWSRDGRFLAYHGPGGKTLADIWVLPMGGPPESRKPIVLVQTEFVETGARFSPDMRWFSYSSNITGRSEIYVRPFDPKTPGRSTGGEVRVSKDGGNTAKWTQGGKEIVFEAPDGALMAVEVSTVPTFAVGPPQRLFLPGSAIVVGTSWDVTADGKRFLVALPIESADLVPITVVTNWVSGLAK